MPTGHLSLRQRTHGVSSETRSDFDPKKRKLMEGHFPRVLLAYDITACKDSEDGHKFEALHSKDARGDLDQEESLVINVIQLEGFERE